MIESRLHSHLASTIDLCVHLLTGDLLHTLCADAIQFVQVATQFELPQDSRLLTSGRGLLCQKCIHVVLDGPGLHLDTRMHTSVPGLQQLRQASTQVNFCLGARRTRHLVNCLLVSACLCSTQGHCQHHSTSSHSVLVPINLSHLACSQTGRGQDRRFPSL